MKTKVLFIGLLAMLIFGNTAFSQEANPASDFEYQLDEAGTGISISKFVNNSAKDVVIPDTIEDLPVTTIGSGAFDSNSSITSVVIPATVTTIEDGSYNSEWDFTRGAFCNCVSLTSVTIPASVKKIGAYAFYSCDALASVVLDRGVREIGNYAFSDCTALETITIPLSVRKIGLRAFRYCSALKTVSVLSKQITWENFGDTKKGDGQQFNGTMLDIKSQSAVKKSGYTGTFK
jgi:hypothetical protein